MLEKPITNAILKAYRARGTFAEKIHATGLQRRGLPDIVACHHGRFIGLEVKRPGGKPTELQLAVLEEIRQAGGVGAVVESAEEALAILDLIDSQASVS